LVVPFIAGKFGRPQCAESLAVATKEKFSVGTPGMQVRGDSSTNVRHGRPADIPIAAAAA
jgi:hypothetical protein